MAKEAPTIFKKRLIVDESALFHVECALSCGADGDRSEPWLWSKCR